MYHFIYYLSPQDSKILFEKYMRQISWIPLCVTIFLLSSCKKEDKSKSYLAIDSIVTDNLIKDVIEEINTNYADNITKEKLEEGAINGMLNFLDEYSLYISQDEFEALNQSARGAYLGIGVEIKQTKEGIEIISVIDDSPAAQAGLKPSDIVTHIDNKEVSNMPIKAIYSKLGSDTGMKITLSGVRNKTEKFDIKLRKTVIQLQTVKLDFVEDIAIIKINYFNEGTVAAVKSAIKDVKKHKSAALILDLRNNPGGILEQAVETAELFLNKGSKIVELKSRNVDESREIRSEENDKLEGKPMALLIDRNSASGSEVVAAALGENKRAIVVGENSYGKGSLQTIIPLPGKGAIKLTTAFLYSPNGNKLSKNGVAPDIQIDQTPQITENAENDEDTQDPTIQRTVDLLHGITALANQQENGE